jgi:magnesium transporter
MATDDWVANGAVTFESAAQHATRRVPIASPDATAGELRAALAGAAFESAAHVVVCEGLRFRGIVCIEDLLAARADVTAAALMDADAPVVAPGTDQEIAAWRAVRHGESALALVDAQGRFAGLIPPHRLLAVLLSEHEEDLSRIGGFLHSTESARRASEEPVPRRFAHRLPWLLVGLAGALLAAELVAGFESMLREQVVLAFFVPGIVYLADAVGTQTETVVVRGLSVGVRIAAMIRRELLTGLGIGVVLALVAFPLVALRFGNTDLAAIVAASLFAACGTASAAAMALPWLIDRLGADPAFGAGPLATVIQDLLSIAIFFGIARIVIG